MKEQKMPMIDLERKDTFMYYGTNVQKQISLHIDEIIKIVHENEGHESEKILKSLIEKVKHIEFQPKRPKLSKMPLMGLFTDPIGKMIDRYEDVLGKMEAEAKQLERIKFKLQRDVIMLEKMMKKNQEYSQQLEQHITVLINAIETLNIKGDESVEILEKRLYDLRISQSISAQILVQSESVIKQSRNFAAKIQEVVINTVPLFKSHFLGNLQQLKNEYHEVEENEYQQKIKELEQKRKEFIHSLEDVNVLQQQTKESINITENTLEKIRK